MAGFVVLHLIYNHYVIKKFEKKIIKKANFPTTILLYIR